MHAALLMHAIVHSHMRLSSIADFVVELTLCCAICRSVEKLMFLVEQAHWFYEVDHLLTLLITNFLSTCCKNLCANITMLRPDWCFPRTFVETGTRVCLPFR